MKYVIFGGIKDNKAFFWSNLHGWSEYFHLKESDFYTDEEIKTYDLSGFRPVDYSGVIPRYMFVSEAEIIQTRTIEVGSREELEIKCGVLEKSNSDLMKYKDEIEAEAFELRARLVDVEGVIMEMKDILAEEATPANFQKLRDKMKEIDALYEPVKD